MYYFRSSAAKKKLKIRSHNYLLKLNWLIFELFGLLSIVVGVEIISVTHCVRPRASSTTAPLVIFIFNLFPLYYHTYLQPKLDLIILVSTS